MCYMMIQLEPWWIDALVKGLFCDCPFFVGLDSVLLDEGQRSKLITLSGMGIFSEKLRARTPHCVLLRKLIP